MKTFSQRMPDDLHDQAVKVANINGDPSLNSFVNDAVAKHVSAVKRSKGFRAKLKKAQKEMEEI